MVSGFGNFIVDFAKRTIRNLDFIQAQASAGDRGVYPVTQLWNSLLGLIVMPHELDAQGGGIEHIPETPMTQLWSQEWPRVTVSGGTEDESLQDLVRNLRNSVAHFNVKFLTGPDNEITSVTLWNQRLGRDGAPIKGSRRWEGQINVEDLDRLARRIAEVYVGVFV
jgi:hypothetical protein